MTDNSQKTWFATALPAAVAAQIAKALHSAGNSLPCRVVAVNGQLVTVSFLINAAQTLPNVTIPIDTSVYDWLPVQVGDEGMAEGGTIYIGGVSGQGGGIADTRERGNLTCLRYKPTANAKWTPPGVASQNQRVVQGPAGALMQTTDGNSSINVTESAITLVCQGKTWTFNVSGFTMSNDVISETHIHHQPNDSHGDTEQPTQGPVNP